jgi:general secretion pathway protein C
MTRWLPKLLTLLMACAFAAVCAYWVMKIAGGPPAPDPRSLNRAVDAPVQSFREPVSLFGNAQTQPISNVKLLGVIAGPDGKGRAILSVNDAPPKSFATGMQVAPGMKLKAVEQRAVVLDNAGVENRVPLPPRTTVAANALAASNAPANMPPRPAFGAQAAPAPAPPPPAMNPAGLAPAPGSPVPGQVLPNAANPPNAANAASAAASAAQSAAAAANASQVAPALTPAQPGGKLRDQ